MKGTIVPHQWRELKAVELALISFAPSLLGKQVAWFTDNTNVVSIVHSGSKVTELQDLALRIFHVCVSSGISLEMKWIPRDLNSFADHLRRIIDFDDYTINDDVFHILDVRWGTHTIDRFACSYNAKLSRFNSRFYQPGTEAVNAFLQDWEFENDWLLPPVSQIARVVDHLSLCNAEGTLVIPMWNDPVHSHFWLFDEVIKMAFANSPSKTALVPQFDFVDISREPLVHMLMHPLGTHQRKERWLPLCRWREK